MASDDKTEVDYTGLDYYEITEALKRCIEYSSAAHELSGFDPGSNPDDPDRYVDHFGQERPPSVSTQDWLVFCAVAKVKLRDYEQEAVFQFKKITSALGVNATKSGVSDDTDWCSVTLCFEEAFYYAVLSYEAQIQDDLEMSEAYGKLMLKEVLELIDDYKLLVR